MPSPAFLLLVATLLPLLSFGVLLGVGKRLGSPLAGGLATVFLAASFLCSLLAMYRWYVGGTMAAPGPAGLVQVRWGYQGRPDEGPIHLPMKWLPVGVSRGGGPMAPAGSPAGSGIASGTGSNAVGGGADHPGWLDLGIYVDSLTIAMFAMVTLVAFFVHWFAVGYMRDDPRFARFFAYLGLFCFSMMGLVLGGTLLQLFIFWELVGLCSYLLIGFWYEKPSATNAAVKAFVTNRVGDVGFLVGFGIMFYYLGNVSLPHLWLALGRAGLGGFGGPVTLADGTVVPGAMLTLAGICLFCGAIGKSAQFPLHVWLPDAMEGPTPISALIHAATMVAAGVYLLGRVFPILTPGAKLFIAIIGLTTLTMAALIAAVQTDIKRVLAYSTISQLGYMVLAMGVGSWTGGLFHLMTHAFIKALLFLAAGSVILAAGHEQELTEYGGLMRKMPVTAFTFGVAVLAIAGVPAFSGYYSKDMILRHAAAFAALSSSRPGASGWYWIFFAVPTAVAYLTAFYMARCWMLAFWGKPRNVRLHERAREPAGLWLWAPLLALAVLSVIAGNWLSIPDLLQGSIRESQVMCHRLAAAESSGTSRRQRFAGFSTAWPGPAPDKPGAEALNLEPGATESGGVGAAELTESQKAHRRGEGLLWPAVTLAPFVGLTLGVLVYLRGFAVAGAALRIPFLRWVHRWLYHRMYFDELYFAVFVAATVLLSRVGAWFDQHAVDGAANFAARVVRASASWAGATDRYVIDGAVNGVGWLARDLGTAARAPQTGRIRLYVTLLALAAAVGLAVTVVIMSARRL